MLPANTAAAPVGYTGTLADAISVTIFYDEGDLVVVEPVGTITAYNTPLALSTSLTLPCSGTGPAVFQPTPTSPTAQALDVTLDFNSQP